MKKDITKRMILKGKYTCILTVQGGETAEVKTEWLKKPAEEEEIFLFCAKDRYAQVKNGRADLPAEEVAAAAVGRELSTKGQLGEFPWREAAEFFRLNEWFQKRTPNENGISEHSAQEKLPAETEQKIAEEPLESAAASAEKTPEIMPKAPARCSACAEGTLLSENPFPAEFPQSVWYRYDYNSPAGAWHYLTGSISEGGRVVSTVTAVPGKYSMKPPAWLREFSMFLQSRQNGQGYWIAVSPYISTMETEE